MLMVQEVWMLFVYIIFRLVMLVMESQAPILNNFQVNYLTHSYWTFEPDNKSGTPATARK